MEGSNFWKCQHFWGVKMFWVHGAFGSSSGLLMVVGGSWWSLVAFGGSG